MITGQEPLTSSSGSPLPLSPKLEAGLITPPPQDGGRDKTVPKLPRFALLIFNEDELVVATPRGRCGRLSEGRVWAYRVDLWAEAVGVASGGG